MEVLSSRIILAVADLARSRRFYEETLGLRIFREYGTRGVVSGVVYFLGGGFLEITAGATSGVGAGAGGGRRDGVIIWVQVPNVLVEEQRLAAAGVVIKKPGERMPWGLIECWIEDPDGTELRLIEVPDDHPIRRRVD